MAGSDTPISATILMNSISEAKGHLLESPLTPILESVEYSKALIILPGAMGADHVGVGRLQKKGRTRFRQRMSKGVSHGPRFFHAVT